MHGQEDGDACEVGETMHGRQEGCVETKGEGECTGDKRDATETKGEEGCMEIKGEGNKQQEQ